MKNKIISLIAAGFLLFTPQLALAAENGQKENTNEFFHRIPVFLLSFGVDVLFPRYKQKDQSYT